MINDQSDDTPRGTNAPDAAVENIKHLQGQFRWRNQMQSSLPIDGTLMGKEPF